MNTPEFEIVGVYPLYGIQNVRLVMSAHVYFPELDLDVRGWMVHYKKDEESEVFPPTMREYDHEEKKSITFPTFANAHSTWIGEIKQKLIEEGKRKFDEFKFPNRFPRTFWNYVRLKSSKRIKPILVEKRSKPTTKKPFAKFKKKRKDKKTFTYTRKN